MHHTAQHVCVKECGLCFSQLQSCLGLPSEKKEKRLSCVSVRYPVNLSGKNEKQKLGLLST